MTDSSKTTPKTPTGGFSGFFKRLWYQICFMTLGTKWNIIEIFTRHRKLDIQKIPRRQGDVAVVTGGARGIGVEIIRKLLILDMHVIIGCRSEQAGKDVVENIRQQGVSTGAAQVFALDLKSLESVRQFSEKVLKRCRRINILINNAGVMLAPYEITKDNFESHFQVNYLSHFLLTQLLLPKLKSTGTAAKPSRIVNVSSVAAYGGKINFEDLQMSKLYSPAMAYMNTKMMQVISAKDLENRLKREEANVHVYSCHPGVVNTDLYDKMCCSCICGCFGRIFFKTPKQGSDTVVYCAVSPKVGEKGGNFFANSKKESLPSAAKDVEIQGKLWKISCELTGITKPAAETSQPVFSVENEHRNSNGKDVHLESRVGEADSDSEHYETKSTADGSLDENHIANQQEINEDIARKLVNSIEVNTESAIAVISKELVDDIVGQSEQIVNERLNSLSEEVLQDVLPEESTQEIPIETSNTKHSLDSGDTRQMDQAENDNSSFQFVTTLINTVSNHESSTKEYGAVSITEIHENSEDRKGSNEMARIVTPNITITNASDAASDSDSDVDKVKSLHKVQVNASVTIAEVEAS